MHTHAGWQPSSGVEAKSLARAVCASALASALSTRVSSACPSFALVLDPLFPGAPSPPRLASVFPRFWCPPALCESAGPMSLRAFGFKPTDAAAKNSAPVAAPASASPPAHTASSKRVRAAAPKHEAARTHANKSQAAANGKSMVQAMLCFGTAPTAAAPAVSTGKVSTGSESIDLVDDEPPATATAAPASSAAASALRHSPRKPTAMDTEPASAASSAPAVRSVLSFVKPPAAPTPAPAAAAAAAPKAKSARAPRKRKETAHSESEADEAEEEEQAEDSAAAVPAASSSKRRKRAVGAEAAASSAAAAPSRRARASASASAAMVDDDEADAVVIPDEAPRRSGRAAVSKQRRSYKEKDEDEGLSGEEEEEEAVDEATSARAAAPARPSAVAAAASTSSSVCSPRKGRAVRAGVTAPLFAAPLPAYLAFGTGAVAAAADSYARSQLHRPLSDRPVNIVLAMRARSSSGASHSRFDGGNLPLFYARQRSNGVEVNRATRTTMQTLLSNEPVTAIPPAASAAASMPAPLLAPTTPSVPTLHGSSFGSSFDQTGLSSLPRMLLARTAPAYSRQIAESGLPIVVRNRWDQGAGAGLTASAFKAYSLNYSPCGRMLAAAGHGGVVKVFHRSPAGLAAPRMAQESVCEDNGAVLSPFEADHMAPITSFVAHKRWASSVKFVPNSSGAGSARSVGDGSGSMLLSTADDSTLKLWSLDSLLTGETEGAAHALATSSLFVHRPKPLDSLSPHDSLMGLYDFDCIAAGSGETSIATASKDGHVVLSTLTASGLRRLGSLASGDPDCDSAHRGVVKSVAWRDAFTLGSAGGNDKIVCIYDVRAGGAGGSGRGSCVARLSGLHALSIHTLRWNPSAACSYQFLTAASDCLIQLCDLRCVGRGPLLTLTQHFPHSITRTDQMYKPVYAVEGSMVITASSSHSVHVYSRSARQRRDNTRARCAESPLSDGRSPVVL